MAVFMLVPKHLLDIFEKIRESPKYEATRDEKIKLYKELNSLEQMVTVEKDKW